ncbi:hypothetical protein M2390_000562 [Mycetocola sp. BIGb0189]|nr:hypothetical protein [Mycetocola sp. BIGb0189]
MGFTPVSFGSARTAEGSPSILHSALLASKFPQFQRSGPWPARRSERYNSEVNRVNREVRWGSRAVRFLLSPFADVVTSLAMLFGGMFLSTLPARPAGLSFGILLLVIGICPMLVRGAHAYFDVGRAYSTWVGGDHVLQFMSRIIRVATTLTRLEPDPHARRILRELRATADSMWTHTLHADVKTRTVLYVLDPVTNGFVAQAWSGVPLPNQQTPQPPLAGADPVEWIAEITRENEEGVDPDPVGGYNPVRYSGPDLWVPIRSPYRICGVLLMSGHSRTVHDRALRVALRPYLDALAYLLDSVPVHRIGGASTTPFP